MRLVTLLALTIVLVEDSADAQVAAMDTESLLDSLEKMPPKKLKKFVRSNGTNLYASHWLGHCLCSYRRLVWLCRVPIQFRRSPG